jgi:multidrug efflux pump subunit AcrB
VVHIEFDAGAFASRKLTIPAVTACVREALRNRSAGDFDVGKRWLIVRVQGAPSEASGLAQLVVKSGVDGTSVYLEGLAKVSIALRKRGDFAIADDQGL